MNIKPLGHVNQNRRLGRNRQRGIALVFTLLLLTMMIALSLAMAIAIGSQTFIAGYYKNYRGAFYAADSGVNVMRQSMLNQLLAAVPATFTSGTVPIPNSTAGTILSNINSTYASWTPVNSSGSWPEQFELSSGTASFSLVSCPITTTPSTGTSYGTVVAGACTNLPPSTDTIQTISYTYAYSVTAIGQVQNSEQQSITDSGQLLINISVSPAGPTTTSFSAWGMFIDQANECDGTTLVPGTITGPVFTNGGFTFTPSTYIFTDNVGFHDTTAGYQPSNTTTCTDYAGPAFSDNISGNKQTIAPQFNGAAGLQLGQNQIPIPTNSVSQSWAVLDGKGVGETAGGATSATSAPTNAPTPQQLNGALANSAGAAYPTSASTGVFMPFVASGAALPSGGTCTPPHGTSACMTGGGVFVQGNAASVTLTASGSVAQPTQVFTIVQGGVTSTITENMAANTTTFTTGGATTIISGVPQNLTGTPADATMVYVNGNIGSGNTGLSGPGAGIPAVQNNYEVTVTANGNITITGDILYATEPVTTTQNQAVSYATSSCCNGDAADFLIPLPSTANSQVLGIYTNNGNVQLNNQQSSGNLEIDASIAAFSTGGSGGLVNTGASINNLNIVGGRIQSTIQNIGATTRNVYFDRRFAQGTFGPPWFPTAVVTPTNVSATSVSHVVQRLQWLDNSATLN
jgi:Tfp pilus assembly protein PilX